MNAQPPPGQPHASAASPQSTTEARVPENQPPQEGPLPLERPLLTALAWNELEAIYDTAPVGLCVLDTHLRYLRINHRLAETNGLSVEQHLGKTVREVVPDLGEGAEAALRRVLETGEAVYGLELTGETPAQPGVKRTWIEHWLPLRNQQQALVGINIVAEEVTERRQAKKALRASEMRYHQLFDAIEDGLCICELLIDEHNMPYDYRFLEVNRTFEHHTGLHDAVGKAAYELIPGLEPHWVEAYAQVALQGQTLRFEQSSNAMGRWFEVYAFPFGSAEDRTFAIQFRDMSAKKQAEEDIRISYEELASSNRQLSLINADLDNFVYTASHDLKAPISNIQGLLHLLESSLSPDSRASPRTQKVLKMMEQSVARFMNTIADLSDIVRLQKQANQAPELLDLAEVIEEVRLDMASAIEEANAQLNIQVEDSALIRFAPKNLRSVVYNLLSNAVKYRDPQRRPIIDIRCEVADEYQLLTVADNGLGMDLSREGKLFSMFQRFHDHVEGTGVGLYIVKKIIENTGGRIEVESQVGEGSTFRVFFKR